MCSGKIERTLDACENHEVETEGLCSSCGYSYEATGRFVCTVCNHTMLWGIIPLSVIHHPGTAFCWEHGIEFAFDGDDLGTLERLFDLYRNSELEIRSRAPPRVRVTLRDAGDELHVTYDKGLDVVEVG